MSGARKSPPRSISDADWLHWPSTKEVFAVLGADGDTVRAVGGAVRNTLLSRPVNEVDLATTAAPEKVLKLADAAGLKSVPTGIDHGTVTVIADHRPFEVTTLRKDVETYGRHAKIAYTDDWAEDASRRDFTINALYVDPDGTLFDPLDALQDIAARRVRFIGDARARVREDYLRILRFFRFNAELDVDEYDKESLLACVREHAGLAGLSGERVQSELLRLLRAPGALAAIYKMFEYGLLVDVLGDAPHLDRLRNLIEIEAALDRKPDPVLRLAALAIWVPEDATRLFEKLRLSNADRSKLKAAAEHGDIAAETYDADILWGLYRRGREDYLTAALVAWAESGMPPGDAVWRGMIARIVDAEIPEFPLTGGDLVSRGMVQGPAVGELLKALEVHWMASGFADGKDKLLQVAEELTTTGS